MKKIYLYLGTTVLALMAMAFFIVEKPQGEPFIKDPQQQPKILNTPKIELVLFFSYHCSFCNRIDNEVHQWANDNHQSVILIKRPFKLSTDDLESRLFYSLDNINLENRFHSTIMNQIHVLKDQFTTNEIDILSWSTQLGPDRDHFLKQWSSPTMKTTLANNEMLANQYNIVAVPTLVMNGNLLTNPDKLSRSSLGFAPGSIHKVLDLMLIESKKTPRP